MNKLPKFFLPNLIVTALIGLVWLFKGPTDQELLANAAKAMDFHPWSGWWSASFLGGASQVPELTNLVTYLMLKAFILPFGPMFGSKLAGLLAIFLGGLGVSAFLRRWTGDERAAWLGGVAYLLGPQVALRLAGNEHMPVVFAMVFAPWVLWSLLRVAALPSWRESLILALLSAGMSLAFTKLAVVFAPLALLFAWSLYLAENDRARRRAFLAGLGRALVLYLPLAVIPLLPALREERWLAMFQYDPFAAWQQNFSLRTVLSWIDRGNLLMAGTPPGFAADLGGFYIGVVALVAGLAALRFAPTNQQEGSSDKKLVVALKILFGGLLFLSWLSAGPRCVAGGMMEFLKAATGVSDFVIPLFWMVSVGQCVLLWVIWPEHRYRDYVRVAAILVYLAVPGFRLYELFPFAHDIRGPWSVWQVGGSLAVAALFGVAGSLLLRKTAAWNLPAGGLAVVLVILLAGDYSIYLLRYTTGALPPGTYPAFRQICDAMRQMPPAGNVFPLSGRYFYLGIPALTGKPIEQEAFNSYFGLSWRRALQGALMASPESIRSGLSLLGCGYVFVDKKDPNTPESMQSTFRSLFPVTAENENFVVFSNPNSLSPGFLAQDFIVFPRESFAMAATAALQLASRNLITLELPGVDPSIPGYAGQVKSQNQIELLPQYQARAGASFVRLPSLPEGNDQSLTYRIPGGGSGWMVSTMAYHPDWRATVDGNPAEVYRAEGALMAVRLNGNSEVSFQFTPPLWYSLSLALGGISWLVALGGLLVRPTREA